jgi:beta-glucanase (GH16 family)
MRSLGLPGGLAAVAAGVWLGLCPARSSATPVGAGPLVWSDEFNGTAVDPTKWTCNEPGVWGDAINTPSAASVGGGMLTIKTWTDPATGKNYNAVMGTQDTYLQKYGYFEARVRFHSSPGMWSAFWMMSPTVGHPIGDPTNAGVEVDVVEHRAKDDTGATVMNRYNTALHWDGYSASEKSTAHLQGPVTGLTNDTWHTYGLLWRPDGYQFYYDDQLMWTRTTPVSARSEYLLLSSEVQNGSWAGNIPTGGYGSQSASTTNMQVDYVRAYALAPEPAGATVAASATMLLMGRRRRAVSASKPTDPRPRRVRFSGRVLPADSH